MLGRAELAHEAASEAAKFVKYGTSEYSRELLYLCAAATMTGRVRKAQATLSFVRLESLEGADRSILTATKTLVTSAAESGVSDGPEGEDVFVVTPSTVRSRGATALEKSLVLLEANPL